MSTVLIVSGDDRLASTIQTAALSVPSCMARRVAGLKDLETNLQDHSVSLVVLHNDDETDPALLDEAIGRLSEHRPRLRLLVVCERYEGEHELRCRRRGVSDYLTRPLELRRLSYLIEASTLRARLEQAQSGAKATTLTPFQQVYEISAPAMRRVLDRVRRIASKDVPVLLSGETGAGKTHLAQLIHASSQRASRPFVAVNCGALQPTLIESELFGHKKGAFTGACADHAGRFSHAQDGTLLLDEIDALSPGAQAKLLRALDERIFEPVGSNESLPLRARLIAGSNRSLEEAAARGEFRSDLFFRLNVIPLTVPPLRERAGEVRELGQKFVQQLAQKHGVPTPVVAESAWEALEKYHWPGNIRELRNAVEYAVAICPGDVIEVADLPTRVAQLATMTRPRRLTEGISDDTARRPRESLARARQEGEYRRLVEVLQTCGNNRSQAAKTLGISRAALYKKLTNFDLTKLAALCNPNPAADPNSPGISSSGGF